MGSNSIFDIFDVGNMDSGMYLNYGGFNDPSNAGLEIDDSFAGASGSGKMGSKKSCCVMCFSTGSVSLRLKDGNRIWQKCRTRDESCSRPGSKACREKMRRDRLNDRFVELGSILEPGKPIKVDKASILIDAARTLNHLRSEAEKLKETNEKLQETIKDLKAEKNELREEKTKLKAEKENLEQQLNAMSMAPPGYMPHPAALHAAAAAAFAAQASAAGNKGMPFAGYPGIAMWQYMPPANTDTSQDSKLRPPAA